MDLISIIVPVYKVEKYLDRCVESIVNQTYSNLEIILVDDGSPDQCPERCDWWAQHDSRIRVIHKENGGLSDARNAGMAIASGKYIAFVDSDDWIAADMYEKLLRCIQGTGSDIASCGAVRSWDDGRPDQAMISDQTSHVLNTQDAMQALINMSCMIQTVWNKLYQKDIAKTIPFEKGKIHEDEFWTWQVIAKARQVATIPDNLYFYFQREDSIMMGGYAGKPMLVIEARYQRYQYIKEFMPQLARMETIDFLYRCRYQGCLILKQERGRPRREYLKKLQSYTQNCELKKDYLKELPVVKKIRLRLMRRHIAWICRFDTALGKV